MARTARQKKWQSSPKGRANAKKHNDIQYAKNRAARIEYASAYQYRVARERRKCLSIYKMMLGCIDCGYREDPRALQFDHVRGDKIGSLGSMQTSSWTRIIAELEKCGVRCANCHLVKTHPDAWHG